MIDTTPYAAYLDIYQAEYERLRAYLRGKTSADTADDVAQEAFLRLWARWDALDNTNRAAWTWEVARNLLIDTYRREARHAGGWTWWTQPDDGWREQAEARTDLARWWPLLTPEQQQALDLHFGEDMTYPRMAAALGVDEVALRRRAQRGRKALERRMTGRQRRERRCTTLR